MNANVHSAVVAARTAEAALVNGIRSTADSLDLVATTPLDDALARLAGAADAVRARLAAGRLAALGVLAGLLADCNDFADGLASYAAEQPRELPAPPVGPVLATGPESEPEVPATPPPADPTPDEYPDFVEWVESPADPVPEEGLAAPPAAPEPAEDDGRPRKKGRRAAARSHSPGR